MRRYSPKMLSEPFFSEKLNNANVENTNTLEICSENNNKTTQEYVKKNNANYYKFLQFLSVKEKSELVKVFNTFIYSAQRISSKVTNNKETIDLDTSSNIETVNQPEFISNIRIDNTNT